VARVRRLATTRAAVSRTTRERTRARNQSRRSATRRHNEMAATKVTVATRRLPMGYSQPGGSCPTYVVTNCCQRIVRNGNAAARRSTRPRPSSCRRRARCLLMLTCRPSQRSTACRRAPSTVPVA
jgi:hypothetical protein